MSALLPVSDTLLLIIAIVIVLAIAAAATYYLFRRPKITREKGRIVSPPARLPDTDLPQAARPVSPAPVKTPPAPVPDPRVLPQPKDIHVTEGRADVTESLRALVDKYSLDQFTVATADGLVFASSGGESAQTDAAQYGELYATYPLAETPGVALFGFTHKGSSLIGIIRTSLSIPDETSVMIENDTKDILNRWV